jgi:hypothetical protein
VSEAKNVLRLLAVGRCIGGTALVLRPNGIARALSAGQPLPPAGIVRVLGGRMLVQGILLLAEPKRPVASAGVAIDAVHALSMITVAAVLPRYRRVALISAGEATLSATVAGLSTVGQG